MIWLDVMIIVIIIVVSAFSLSIGPRVQEQGYTHSLAGCLTPMSGYSQPLIIIRKVRVTTFSISILIQKYEGWQIQIKVMYD